MAKPKVGRRQETKKGREKKQSEAEDEDTSPVVNCCVPIGNNLTPRLSSPHSILCLFPQYIKI